MVYFGGFFDKLEFSWGFHYIYISIIYLPRVLCLSVCDSVCVCVCHNCGTLCYSFSFSNQTDQGDETEGLEREGQRWRDRKGTDR